MPSALLGGYRDLVAIRSNPSIVVYSDVDRVLRDPHLPRFAAAAAILKSPAVEDAALVLCSGKTRAELEFIQQKLDITHPFICESGGAVFIPHGYFEFDIASTRQLTGHHAVEFGRPYDEVVEILHRTAARLRIGIVGFSDMSIEEVAQECDLPLLQARLAKLREYEEPFRLLDPASAVQTRLVGALEAAGLRCTKSGSFHRVGGRVDTSIGVSLLNSLYRRVRGDSITVGVTHIAPDSNLLRLVDQAIMVPDHDIGDEAVDVVDWAEAIVDRVKEVHGKLPTSATRGDDQRYSTNGIPARGGAGPLEKL